MLEEKPPRKAWREWYDRNKEVLNAKRKKSYAENSEHRTNAVEYQRAYRADRPRTVADGRQYRTVDGVKVEVFRIGHVATATGRTEQVIRIWERDGKIPKPSLPGGQRYYTQKQVKLLIEFAEVMNQVRYDPKIRAQALSKKTSELNQKWTHQ